MLLAAHVWIHDITCVVSFLHRIHFNPSKTLWVTLCVCVCVYVSRVYCMCVHALIISKAELLNLVSVKTCVPFCVGDLWCECFCLCIPDIRTDCIQLFVPVPNMFAVQAPPPPIPPTESNPPSELYYTVYPPYYVYDCCYRKAIGNATTRYNWG